MQGTQETWVPSLFGKMLWRREWQPTPVFFPGKSLGRRSLEGCSMWVAKSETELSDWAQKHKNLMQSEMNNEMQGRLDVTDCFQK